jgi:hypothetical protein
MSCAWTHREIDFRQRLMHEPDLLKPGRHPLRLNRLGQVDLDVSLSAGRLGGVGAGTNHQTANAVERGSRLAPGCIPDLPSFDPEGVDQSWDANWKPPTPGGRGHVLADRISDSASSPPRSFMGAAVPAEWLVARAPAPSPA